MLLRTQLELIWIWCLASQAYQANVDVADKIHTTTIHMCAHYHHFTVLRSMPPSDMRRRMFHPCDDSIRVFDVVFCYRLDSGRQNVNQTLLLAHLFMLVFLHILLPFRPKGRWDRCKVTIFHLVVRYFFWILYKNLEMHMNPFIYTYYGKFCFERVKTWHFHKSK